MYNLRINQLNSKLQHIKYEFPIQKNSSQKYYFQDMQAYKLLLSMPFIFSDTFIGNYKKVLWYKTIIITSAVTSVKYMGPCTSGMKQMSYISQNQGLYQQVLKCPNGHWLAFYETQTCTSCQTKNMTKPATINCIKCDYGLCQHCFSQKFTKWQRNVRKLNPKAADQLLQLLHTQIKSYLENQEKTNVHNRFNSFLEKKQQELASFKLLKKPSLRSSLEIRIQKIAKLCQQVYHSQAHPQIA